MNRDPVSRDSRPSRCLLDGCWLEVDADGVGSVAWLLASETAWIGSGRPSLCRRRAVQQLLTMGERAVAGDEDTDRGGLDEDACADELFDVVGEPAGGALAGATSLWEWIARAR